MTEPIRDGLPPVVAPGARVLILGSFPSERSLESGEYYANRRNQFWRLLGAVFDFDADAPYAERIAETGRHRVALWDVVRSCRRAGSMDHAIERDSLTINDIGALLTAQPQITDVVANGLTAARLYERHAGVAQITMRLPSSSGALPMSFADKLGAWRPALAGPTGPSFP